jgi:hypothetical protein
MSVPARHGLSPGHCSEAGRRCPDITPGPPAKAEVSVRNFSPVRRRPGLERTASSGRPPRAHPQALSRNSRSVTLTGTERSSPSASAR